MTDSHTSLLNGMLDRVCAAHAARPAFFATSNRSTATEVVFMTDEQLQAFKDDPNWVEAR